MEYLNCKVSWPKLSLSVVSTLIYCVKGSDKTLLDFVHGELNRAGDFEGQRLTGTVSSMEEMSQQWKEFTAYVIMMIIYLFTAIGLLPCGSGYFTCKQNMKLVTTRFKSAGLHVVATWNVGNHLSICL